MQLRLISRRKARQALRQAAARRRRVGSVMIMVVALLVMLALVGTAYIATSTTDRSAAVQSSANTQADLLLQGIIARIEGELAGDAFSGGSMYRPAQSPANDYDHYDAPGRGKNMAPEFDDTQTVDQQDPEPAIDPRNRNDDWLSERVPAFRRPGLYHGVTGGAADYIWPYVSGPIGRPYEVNTLTGAVTHYAFFEDPVSGIEFGRHNAGQIPFREDVRIGSKTVGKITYPALRAFEDSEFRVAADNDGDGIADGFFTRLAELGQLQGLTWYASWRVIDNAAAINLNTAWDNLASTSDPQGKAILSQHYPPTWKPYFPSNIALWDLLSPKNPMMEMAYLDEYRLGHPNVASKINNQNRLSKPFDEVTHNNRSDYDFNDRYDLLWMQLGRRLQVPGIIGTDHVSSVTTGNPVWARRLPEADTLGLAAGFVVRLQNNASWSENYQRYLGHTITERALFPYTLNFRNGDQINPHLNDQPYDLTRANAVKNWFERNFDYERNGLGDFDSRGEYSRRALFTTVNPVADRIRAHYTTGNNGSEPNAGVPEPGDMLPYFPEYLYDKGDIKRDPKNNAFEGYTYSGDKTPWSLAPTRAPLNTAGFRELFRAYWNVMAYDRGAQTGMGVHSPFWTGERVQRQQDRNTEEFYEGYSNIYETTNHRSRMFRSTLRDNNNSQTSKTASENARIRLPGSQMALLRAAIAAVNTIDMRDADDTVTTQQIKLYAYRDPSFTNQQAERDSRIPVEIRVYGYEKQPFISEVYVNTMKYDPEPETPEDPDPAKRRENKDGFVAVELVNPHSSSVSLAGWKLLLINRRHDRDDAPVNLASFTVKELYTFPANVSVSANSHLVLHNFDVSTVPGTPPQPPLPPLPPGMTQASPAKFVPPSFLPGVDNDQDRGKRIIAWGNNAHFINQLSHVIADTNSSNHKRGGELVLVRSGGANTDLRDLAPVDNFDFTGIKLSSNDNEADLMHYARKSPPPSAAAGQGNPAFHVVYPGRYEGFREGDEGSLRQEGTNVRHFNLKDPTDPSLPLKEPALVPPPFFGTFDLIPTFTHPFEQPITLADPKWFAKADTYPFGGFGAVTDVYRIPFIGAYMIRPLDDPNEHTLTRPPRDEVVDTLVTRIYEMNGISMDTSFADDTDDTGTNNKWELVGRFWPVGDFENLKPDIAPDQLDIQGKADHHALFDYEHHRTERSRLDNSGKPLPVDIRYLWARDVLDYFTVLAPHDDYAPFGRKNPWREILNSDTQAAKEHGQAFVPPVTEGLVNINTAPLPVLAMLPFTDLYDQNVLIARQIIEYRERYGPFAHLADLLRVPALAATIDISHTGPGENLFEWVARPLARVSNMITTRSDSFTAYVTLQGWRNAGGGANAEMVVQRRAVVVFDRSGVIKSVNADGARYDRGVKSMYMQLD